MQATPWKPTEVITGRCGHCGAENTFYPDTLPNAGKPLAQDDAVQSKNKISNQ